MFTLEENLIKCVFFYEIMKADNLFLLYPQSFGMSVDEFICENKLALRDLKIRINKQYKFDLRGQHLGAIKTAIRFFLQKKNIRDVALGGAMDISERPGKIEEFKATLPVWSHYSPGKRNVSSLSASPPPLERLAEHTPTHSPSSGSQQQEL